MKDTFDTFYIDKSSNTHADELLVAGVVRWLERTLRRQSRHQPADISWQDKGAYYLITTTVPLRPSLFAENQLALECAPFVRTPKNGHKLPDVPQSAVLDYETQKERNKTFWEAFKALPSDTKRQYGQGGDIAPHVSVPEPHEAWDLLRMINPHALTSYNGLMEQWWEASAQATAVLFQLIAQLFSQSPNNISWAETEWKKIAKAHGWPTTSSAMNATASQFFNPSQGKGINRAKANGTGLGNIKSFWLLEWFKAVGMFEAGFTRTMRGSNDRKTYLPVVGHMTHRTHRQIMKKFKSLMRFPHTAVLSDILTVMRYIQAFIDYTETVRNQPDENDDFLADLFANPTPADFMHGFQMAYYKDMGNAVVTMNLAFLNLPRWVTLTNAETAQAYAEILTEHEQIVTQLKEDRGEEIDLLQSYRDFIVADNLRPFLDFTAAYGSYIISQREKRSGYAYQFSDQNLRRLFMSSQPTTYAPILENQGFQNIAYAIRQSTVIAQMRKKEGDRRYDVRYGLGQDLLRKSQYADEFLKAITQFITKYNAENAQVMETRSGPYRRSIRTDDVADIVQLIDDYGDAELICKMLIAFGYARDSKAKAPTDNSTNNEKE